jgi:hypothetical protein
MIERQSRAATTVLAGSVVDGERIMRSGWASSTTAF